jgi:hypothetical protein
MLFGFPGNQGGSKEDTISRERVTIRRVTGTCRIRVCLKLKRARTREEQPARGSATKVSKNSKEVSVMKLGGCGDKLTQNVNSIGDVRTSDPKVDETNDKMSVASRIGKRPTISGPQLSTKLHGCVNYAVIGESSTREKILNALLLGEVDASRRGRNFETKEVTKRT